ncbi:MAG: potassium channel family protein [Actinomycetota bacterium]
MRGWLTDVRDLGRGLRNFWRDPAGRAVLAVAGTVIGVGTVFYRVVEDLRWIDSLYFCIITLATVGYGDISPTTVAGKVFTMFYVVVGVGVFVALVTTTAHHLIEAKRPDPHPPEEAGA